MQLLKHIYTGVFLFTTMICCAQDYISKQYSIQNTIKNIPYGIAQNYLNESDTLKLDIYKPAGNTATNRPLLVLVHGGAWVGGDKSETSLIQTAQEFVKRGYVVATVNYRLGTHKANWALTPFQKDVNAAFHLVYISDSAEVMRAWYRAIQDVKGAIRFLKARYKQDSICTEAVYVGGESAGGFNAMGVAFLDKNSEKPASCAAISDVPMPQSNLLDNYPGSKVSSAQLKRPDLGDVDGSLNINGHHAKVKGVLNLFGGLLAESISKNWMAGQDSMLVYMTHQSCDGIVPCNAAICLSPMSINCNLGYTPFHTKWPISYGSCALNSVLSSGSTKIKQLKTEIFNCDPIVFPLTDCIRYAQNGSYHWTINIPQRCDSIARFLSTTTKSLTQNCKALSIKTVAGPSAIRLFPNPSSGEFVLSGIDTDLNENIEIYNVLGKRMEFEVQDQNKITLRNTGNESMFFVKVRQGDFVTNLKLILSH